MCTDICADVCIDMRADMYYSHMRRHVNSKGGKGFEIQLHRMFMQLSVRMSVCSRLSERMSVCMSLAVNVHTLVLASLFFNHQVVFDGAAYALAATISDAANGGQTVITRAGATTCLCQHYLARSDGHGLSRYRPTLASANTTYCAQAIIIHAGANTTLCQYYLVFLDGHRLGRYLPTLPSANTTSYERDLECPSYKRSQAFTCTRAVCRTHTCAHFCEAVLPAWTLRRHAHAHVDGHLRMRMGRNVGRNRRLVGMSICHISYDILFMAY